MKNFYVVLSVVAIAGAVVVGMALRGGGSAVLEPVELGEMTDQDRVELARGEVYGNPDAPITIMEFGDYQCDHCATFALTIKVQVDMAYIETGQAKLVFHDFPLGLFPHSFVAARAARCAGEQDRYFDYHDQLFRTQREWSPMERVVGHFKELAANLELDTDAFRRVHRQRQICRCSHRQPVAR